jgi:hypothetical protein
MFYAENTNIQLYSSVTRILGMDISTFIYVIIGMGVLGWILWYFMDNQNKHKKYMKMAEGHCYCFFGDKSSGVGDFELCEIATNGVITEEDKGSGARRYIKRIFGNNSGEEVEYYSLPGHGWMIPFPFGKPPLQQTKIALYFFYKNLPSPQFPVDPEKWNPGYVTQMTSAVARMTKKESSLRILAEELNSPFSDIKKIFNYLKNTSVTMWCSIGNLVLTLILLVMIFGINGTMGIIAKFLTGK